MIEHLCSSNICQLRDRETLFNNSQIHDYPQWHMIKTDLPIDEVILQTGMVTSKSQLKRLYRQKAVQWKGNMLKIGQRRLIFHPIGEIKQVKIQNRNLILDIWEDENNKYVRCYRLD